MLEMKVTITAATDLVAVLNSIAAALDGKNLKPVASTKAPTGSIPVAQTATPIAPTVSVVTPAPAVTPAANVAPAPIVPTSTPQYTLDMIATAGSTLIDAGKMDQLMQLLSKFGVASLTDLKTESYGAVAGELRALGAEI